MIAARAASWLTPSTVRPDRDRGRGTDGRVVSLNHGCGAHSEAQLRKKQLPPPLPDHVFDTVSVDDYEEF